MKRLTIFLILLGCITLSSHAWVYSYDRNIDPRSSGYDPCNIIPADSTLTTILDGVEMSAMDYAELYVTITPEDKFGQAHRCIVGYKPSPRLKKLDRNSTERQKLIIADNDFYVFTSFEDPYWNARSFYKLANPPERRKIFGNYCMADSLEFNFDLSTYSCDFDIYILILHTDYIYDDAFCNFKFSDNIKSVNIYLAGPVYEIGHNAFTPFKNIESVDVRLMKGYDLDGVKYTDYTHNITVHSDSFSQETYDNAHLLTAASESKINDLLTNPNAWNYTNNIYKFFNNWHSGVEDIAIDASIPKIALIGNLLTIQGANPGQSVEIFNIDGIIIGKAETDSEGSFSYTIDYSGIVLVKVGEIVSKFVVF